MGGGGPPPLTKGGGGFLDSGAGGSPLTASRGVGHHIVGTVVWVGCGATLTDGLSEVGC